MGSDASLDPTSLFVAPPACHVPTNVGLATSRNHRMLLRVTAWIGCWLALTVAAVAQEPAPDENASEPTAEQAARLQERDELVAQAQGLQGAGQLTEAIEVAQQVLAIEREIFGEEHAEIAGTYGFIAGMQEAAEDFPAAEQSRQTALVLLTKLHGVDDWRVTDAWLALEHTRLLAGLDDTEREELSRSEALNYQVFDLWSAGKSREALPLAEEALAIRRRLCGDDHPLTALSLFNVAAQHTSIGDYARAEPLQRQALEIWKKLLGEEHPDYAASLNNLAALYYAMGDYARAEPLYRQALEIWKKVHGEEHPEYANSLNNLAELYRTTGNYPRAEPLYRQALEIQRKMLGEGHPDYAASLNNLAAVYKEMGDYSRAEPLYRQALEIVKQVHGEEHPDYARSLNGLGELYHAMGDYARAEPLYRQARDIVKQVRGEEHPDYATSLNDLAALYHAMWDYARSEPLYRKALEIRRRVLSEEHPAYAASLNNLAALYYAMGDYAQAEPLYRQALEIVKQVHGEEHPNYAGSVNNLALLYYAMDDYARAEPLYRQALEIVKQVHGEEHPDYALSLNNLALLNYAMGDYTQAEPLFRQALDIQRKALGEEHPEYALSLDKLAVLYHSTGDYTSSIARLRDAAAAYEAARLRVAAQSLDRAVFGARQSPYRLLAAAEAGHGDAIKSWRALEANLARGLLDEAASRAGLQLSAAEERERVGLVEANEKLQPRILRLVTQTDPNDKSQAELAELLEERSAAAARLARLAAALSSRQVADVKEVQASLPTNGAFVTWVDVSTRDGGIQEHWGCVLRSTGKPAWVRLPGTGPDGAWTDQDAALPKRLREALAQAAAPEEVQELSRELVAQRIEPLLPHLEGVERLYVAAVNDMAGVPVDVLTDQFTISYTPSGTQLARLRERERPTDEATLLALGDPIFAQPGDETEKAPTPAAFPPGGLLIAQVIAEGNAAKARIESGDVLLTYAGTELESVQQLGELIAAHAMDESVTVTVWRESEKQPAERKLAPGKLGVALDRQPAPEAIARRRENDLLLASVTRGKTWDELPGTRIEIAGLAELFPSERVTLLADSDASEQRLAALRESGELAHFRYLHLATHGQANQASAFESALILAQDDLSTVDDVAAGEAFYDGRLTANEILEHWKLNAELVTLSSCESGLGRAGGGEGFLGFAQALLLAGSRSVCLSLWEVDDTATALLMERFYQNLLGKREGLDAPLPKAEALAEAKRWLRSLTASRAADLAAELSHGVARGAGHKTTVVDLFPPEATDPEGHPYEHPYFWAAFVLMGDPE